MARLDTRSPASTRSRAPRCCTPSTGGGQAAAPADRARVKELAGETGAVSYAAALAELFALDPDAVDAVTRPEGLER